MLGGFSVTYQGKEILIGRKNTLKFIQLLQLIWLRGERRISKKELIDALYDRREVADANNSINNLLHQVKKQLPAAGLPDCNYIIRIEGDYMAGTEIPVRTDVQSFVELAEAGDRELTIHLQWTEKKKLSYLVLKEAIPFSQRVEKFSVWYAAEDGRKEKMVDATTIGYKKIIDLQGVETDAIEIRIEDSRVAPVISFVGVY